MARRRLYTTGRRDHTVRVALHAVVPVDGDDQCIGPFLLRLTITEGWDGLDFGTLAIIDM